MNTRIDDIEVLRALAVLFVILQHTFGNLITWPSMASALIPYFNGGSGVDLFFAISGFVIAKDFMKRVDGLRDGAAKFEEAINFWIKRIWRLLPSAWLWLAIILLLSMFFNSSGVFGSVTTNAWATLAGALNFANFRLADAFGHYPYGASFVYWSLSLEEQFYLVFPLVLIFLRPWFVWLVLALLFFQLFSERSMLMMMLRTDALMFGILLAMLGNSRYHGRFDPRFLEHRFASLFVIGGCSLALVFAASSVMSSFSYRMSLVAILAGGLVYAASYDKSYVMRDGVMKRVMVYLGARSYALYLTHIPAFFLCRESWLRATGDHTPSSSVEQALFVLAAYLLMFVLAEMNYSFVECPLRRKGRRIVAQRLEKPTLRDPVGRA